MGEGSKKDTNARTLSGKGRLPVIGTRRGTKKRGRRVRLEYPRRNAIQTTCRQNEEKFKGVKSRKATYTKRATTINNRGGGSGDGDVEKKTPMPSLCKRKTRSTQIKG